MRRNSTFPRLGRVAAALAMGLTFSVAGLSGARAASPAADGVQHFFNCFDLMLTDSAAHAQQCGPNPYVPLDHLQLAPTMGGGPDCTITTNSGILDFRTGGLRIASLGDGREYLPALGGSGFMLAGQISNPCAPQPT